MDTTLSPTYETRGDRTQPTLWMILAAAVLLQLVFVYLALAHGYVLTLFPVIAAVGLLAFLKPRWGLVGVVALWFVRYPLSSVVAIYPAEVLLIIISAGFAAQRLIYGRPVIIWTPVNRWIFLFIGALTISWLLSTDKAAGFINWGHHLLVLLFFFVVVGLSERGTIRTCLRVFIGICVILSLWNVYTFVLAEGHIRAFGPTGTVFTGLLSLAITYGTARFLLATRITDPWLWGGVILLLLLGQFVTQSRGAMFQTVTGMAFAGFVAYRWGRHHGQPDIRRRIVMLLTVLSVSGLLLLAIFTPMIVDVLDRYATRSGNELASVNMRLFLWKTALRTFLEYPFFGIGLAQEDIWVRLFPAMRYDPLFVSVRGLSVHNDILGYLNSTGLVGSVVLAVLLVKTLIMGTLLIPGIRRRDDAAWQLGVWCVVFVIVTRTLYEGHLFYSISGITSTTFFGFLAYLTIPYRSRASERVSGLR
ncbi:MAG: hypothetical protein Kow0074_04010 [Candidatus Zixiibacteriota bacterium]